MSTFLITLGICYLIGAIAFAAIALLDPDVSKTPKIIGKILFVSLVWWIATIMYVLSDS